jgi:thiamine biosynthesis protein ThiI
MPIIRPVACYDKLEIIALAKKIETYETSILPFEDCCTIFVPKHPVINPKLDKCTFEEGKLNYEDFIKECLENVYEVSDFDDKYKTYI